MLSAVRVRKDDTFEFIGFASREDAQRFIAFVKQYQTESGAGNGYGAYWVFNDEITDAPPFGDGTTDELEFARIVQMAMAISRARAVNERTVSIPSIRYDHDEDDGIIFEVGNFLPHGLPAVGEMYRLIKRDDPEVSDVPSEGRVMTLTGEEAEVVGWDDESDDGVIADTAQRHRVPLTAIMRIPDWRKRSRERKASELF